jgi:nitroreductase
MDPDALYINGGSIMSVIDDIKARRSFRTFDGRPLSAGDAEKIMSFAAAAETPYEIDIEYRLFDAEKDGLSSPVIAGAGNFIAGKMKKLPHAEEAFGYSFEKILLYAMSLGIGSTWIAGTMDRAQFERAVGLGEGEVMPCISPLGYPAKKMSLRETVMRKGVKADSRFDFGKIFFDGSFEAPLTAEKAGRLAEPLEMVRLAPSAVNKQPWRVVVKDGAAHFYEYKTKGYDSNGWDLQKIDVGIALCHFELSAKELGIPVSFKIDDPGISLPENTVYVASYV